MKKITILLPAYNEEPSFPLIKESMEKVLQDNPGYEWEFLFVNDGSTTTRYNKLFAYVMRIPIIVILISHETMAKRLL